MGKTTDMPKSVWWLERITWFQVILNVVVVTIFFILGFYQPPDGYRSGIWLEFLEIFTGHKEVVYFSTKEASKAAIWPFLISFANAGILVGIDKKWYKLAFWSVLLNIVFTFMSISLPVIGVVLLVLIQQSKTRAYFKK